MAHIHPPSDIPVRYMSRSKNGDLLVGGLFLVGLVSFLYTLTQDADLAWKSYVSNWLYFTSLSMGAALLGFATWIVKARWNWSVRRVSLAFVAFLPIAFVLFLPMLGLGESYFPWIEAMASDPLLQKKAAYLNMPFLITRNVVGLILLFGGTLYFTYLSLRPDTGLADGGDNDDAGRALWRTRFGSGWLGQEAEEVRSYQRMTRMAPALVILYALVMSMIAIDWGMSLEPHWYSTMFPVWFFMGAFWGGITLTAFTVVVLKGSDSELDRMMGLQQLHDLGKLTFAFCVCWGYLFFAQYLVIWYGKLPAEQAWIVRRAGEPWGKLSALVLVLCFVIPFVGLMGRKAKMTPRLLQFFAAIILVGLWLERYMLIFPSLHHEGDQTFSVWTPLIGLMFLALFLGAARWFFSTFPVVQIWQPMSDPEVFEAERVHPAT